MLPKLDWLLLTDVFDFLLVIPTVTFILLHPKPIMLLGRQEALIEGSRQLKKVDAAKDKVSDYVERGPRLAHNDYSNDIAA